VVCVLALLFLEFCFITASLLKLGSLFVDWLMLLEIGLWLSLLKFVKWPFLIQGLGASVLFIVRFCPILVLIKMFLDFLIFFDFRFHLDLILVFSLAFFLNLTKLISIFLFFLFFDDAMFLLIFSSFSFLNFLFSFQFFLLNHINQLCAFLELLLINCQHAKFFNKVFLCLIVFYKLLD
jgi:hypothetical protein